MAAPGENQFTKNLSKKGLPWTKKEVSKVDVTIDTRVLSHYYSRNLELWRVDSLKPSFGKTLALAAIICMLAIAIVPANAYCTLACCGQSDSQDLHTGPGASGQPTFPSCSVSLENSSCNLLSDLAFEVRQPAILSMPWGKTSTRINLAAARATAVLAVSSHRHFISPPRLLTPALNVPLYLRNLSLLI